MARKIGQIRYYGDGKHNSPETLSGDMLTKGTVPEFQGKRIVQLGVQTLPGVEMYINSSARSIIIGATGIYELNVEGMSIIHSIQFSTNSITMINNSKSSNAYIILDYIYEED